MDYCTFISLNFQPFLSGSAMRNDFAFWGMEGNISANFKISPDFSNVDMDGAIATFSALINASLFVPEALIYVPLSTLNLLKTVFVNSNSTLVSVDDKAILLILNPSEIL